LSSAWAGTPYNPNPGLGIVGTGGSVFSTVNGATQGITGSYPVQLNTPADYDFTISNTGMTMTANPPNASYTYTGDLSAIRTVNGIIAFGAYATNTKWGTVTIEGEITLP
jgi:hypothetical protein